jgi:hypothetical protein
MKRTKCQVTKVSIGLVLGSSLWLSSPALASTTGSNPFTDFWNQITSQFSQIGDDFLASLNELQSLITDSLPEDFDSIISDAIGVLGIPDPELINSKIEDIISAEETPIYSVETVGNEIDRQITTAKVSSVLSKEGQQQQLELLENTQDSVNLAEQYSQAAQNSTVTQEVMKQIAQQNSINASLMGQVSTQMQEVSTNQQLSNLNLTNISRSLDGQNQLQQQEKLGAGFDTLRTSSLAGLF